MIYKILLYNFAVMVMFNFGHPVTPLMLVDKDVYSGLNSILFGFFSIASFLFAPYWGRHINTHGYKKLLIYIPLCYACAQLLLCFADATSLMILARFIAGAFSVAFIISISAYTNSVSATGERAKNFGLIMVSSSLAGIVGQVFIGLLATHISGYYFAFILQFLVAFIFIFFGRFIDEVEFEKKENVKHKIEIKPFYIVITLMSCAITMYTANIGFYITEQFNATSLQVSLINAMSSAIMLFANLVLIKVIISRLSAKKSFNLQIIFAIIAIGLVIISIYAHMQILVIVFIAFYILALSVYRPLSQDYVVAKKNIIPAIELANIAACNSLGMVLGSFIGGIAYSIYPNLPFILILCILLISLVVFKKEKNV